MPLRTPTLAVLGLLGCTFGASAQSPAGPAQPQSITALNAAFRAAYSDAKTRALTASGPTLIVNGDQLVLLRGGRRLEANVATETYETVKTIAHIPLAIYVTLTPGDGAIDETRLKLLANLRELIVPAADSLDTLKLSAATLGRQKKIVTASLALINEAMGRRELAPAALLEFTRRMAPLVLENVNEAARAQLDGVHAQVSAWRRDMTAQEWNQLHVLIIGPHMPRQDLVVAQYFFRLLREPAEGGRIIYAESLWEESKALDLLGTHLLDGWIGDAFFRDDTRMHRDLLGDAAKDYLPRLLPQ